MRNDVKTLIAALTTERNSLDRAITALRQMSDGREPEPVQVGRVRRKEGKRRVFLTDEAKRQIVREMRDTAPGYWSETASRLAREHRAPVNTIYKRWQKWDELLNNGNAPAPIEATPELTGAIQ